MTVISGTTSNDNIQGTAQGDVITASSGNDKVDAGAGNDLVDGGTGNDKIEGGLGNDTLLGGAGNDKIEDKSGANLIYGGSGNDEIELGSNIGSIVYGDGFSGFSLLGSTVEFIGLAASLGNDKIEAGGGNDLIYGDNGNNLYGNAGGGNDEIEGGAGNDLIFGEGGNDDIHGDDGDDTLIGGAGADRLAGGVGNDRFVYRNTFESTAVLMDRIADFTTGQDKIDLTAMLAGGLAWSSAGAALNSVWVTQVSGNTFVHANVNRNTDFVVQLDGLRNLSAGDFLGLRSATNQPPTTTPVTLAAIAEDSGVRVITQAELLANAVDPEGASLVVTGLSKGSSAGTLVDNGDGTWSYTSDSNDDTSVTFSYTISDGSLSTTGSAVLDITSVNDAPSGAATAVLLASSEDTPYVVSDATLLEGFSDIDSPTLSVTGLSAGINGAVVRNSDGTWTITPTDNYSGPVDLVYNVTDGTSAVAATRSFNLAPVNDAPSGVATAVLLAGSEDTPYVVSDAALLEGFSDIDSSALSVTGLSAGINGAVVRNSDGTWTITPTANYSGPVDLAYNVTDGTSAVAATRSFDLVAVADAPILVLAPASSTGDSPIALAISAALADLDGSEILGSVVISDVPEGWVLSVGVLDAETGSYTLAASQLAGLTITPPAGASGSINLTVTATSTESSNGLSASSSGIVQVNVSQQNQASGQAIDGYIAGATVFADTNANGVLDTGEARAVTDAGGNFTLVGGVGNLVMVGGIDVSTGKAFGGILRAPAGSTVVTPLTTLVAALVAQGQTPATAEANVSAALGLAASINLLAFDPVAAVAAGGAGAADAAKVLAAGIQVQNAIVQVSALLTGAGATDAGTAVVSALANLVSSGSTVDLSGAATTATLINAAATESINVEPANISAVAASAAAILAQSNASITSALAGGSGLALLEDLAQVAVIAQGADLSTGLAAAGASGATTPATGLEAAYTGTNLTNQIVVALVGDVSGGINGSIGNDTLTGDNGDNAMAGLEGNDKLIGLAGDDTLLGGNGNDTLLGGVGNDTLRGGAGNDVINGGVISQLLTPDDFNDTDRADYSDATQAVIASLATGTASGLDIGLDQLIGIEVLEGGSGNDHLTGSGTTFAEAFVGGAGDDIIDGAGSLDTASYANATGAIIVTLGSGNVNAPNAAGSVTGNASVGTDTLVGVELIRGTAYADSFTATGFVSNSGTGNTASTFNSFEGMGGNDTIVGNGSTRADYRNAAGAVTVTFVNASAGGGSSGTASGGGVGTDTLSGIGFVTGSAWADTFTGGASTVGQIFEGRGDNDFIDGGVGFDEARYGFDGPITIGLAINMAAGTVTGDLTYTGADTLRGVEAIFGSVLADNYNAIGFGGSSTNAGTFGTYNEFEGNAGNDVIIGNGNTLIRYGSAREGVTVNLALGTAVGGASVGSDTITLGSVLAVRGSNFNDSLTGDGQGNTLSGLAGDDILAGLTGNDTLDGGAGIDTADYSTASGAVQVNLGATQVNASTYGPSSPPANLLANTATGAAGTDSLQNIENLIGSGFGDLLVGSSGANRIEGGAGNDSLVGGAGDDSLYGGAGSDTFFASGTLAPFNREDGQGNDLLDGGAILDRISYTDLNVVAYTFGPAINVDLTKTSEQVQDGTGGKDTLVNINFIIGSLNADTMMGSTAMVAEFFQSNGGNDTIDGGVVTDTLNLTNGNRFIYGNGNFAGQVDMATNTAIGGQGTVRFYNFNTVQGSSAADMLYGTDRTDLTEGFDGRGGKDLIDGRGGFDIVFYNYAGSAVNVDLAQGRGYASVASGLPTDEDLLFNIESVRGSNFADTLTGGNDASDALENFGGNGGNDTINGGSGFDRADYSTSYEGVNVTLGGAQNGTASDGIQIVYATNAQGVQTATFVFSGGVIGTDTLISVEAVRGSNFNDTLTGSNDTGIFESFEGGDGADTIDGNGGIDRASYFRATSGVVVALGLSGAAGSAADGYGSTDILRDIEDLEGSRDFGDRLTGNELSNKLDGLGGNDTLTGGGGADTFVWAIVPGSLAASPATDIVTDFDSNDLIDLQGLLVGATHVGADPGNLAQYLSFVFSGGNTTVSIDSDGAANGAAVDQIIILAGYNTGGANSSVILQNLLTNGNLFVGINGTLGNDILTGDSGNNTIAGRDGNDLLVGLDGNDTLLGGAGNDTLRGGAGDDVINGGVISQRASVDDFNDLDRVDYSDATQSVIANLATRTASGADVGTDQLIGIEELAGGSGNDSLTGSSTTFAEFFVGGAGNDTIDGAGLLDRAIYSAATAAITATLGSGNASAPSATGGVTGNASVGTDTLRNVEQIVGTAFDDTFTASGFVSASGTGNVLSTFNSFEGMGGDDTINGNGGTRAEYRNATGPVTVTLVDATPTVGGSSGTASGAGVGTDTLSGINYVLGSAYADSLIGGLATSGQNFEGGAGNDTINGGVGFDNARYGFDGAITTGLTINMAAGTVTGDAVYTGTDTLLGVESIIGSVLADTYDARSFSNSSTNSGSFGTFNDFEGLAGNDLIWGNGNTALRFTLAQEGVTVNFALGTVVGGPSVGFDTILSGAGSVLEVTGSNFNDVLIGSNNQNIALPDPFTTTESYFGRAGNDFIDGGGGWDVVRYHSDFVASGINVVRHATNANTLIVTGDPVAIGTDTLVGISQIRGTNFADNYNATGYNPNAIYGNYNEFDGGGGSDDITGNGNTRILYVNETSAVTVNLDTGSGAGFASGASTGSDVLRGGITGVIGSAFNDTLQGSGANDMLQGRNGDDLLNGVGGNDTLRGGEGIDTLNGGDGNDRLSGENGADFFKFDSVLNAATNVDTITDFTVNVDKILLDDAVFAGLSLGALGADNFGAAPGLVGAATDADDFILYDSTAGNLFYDSDGSGTSAPLLWFAHLDGNPALTHADFSVI